MARLEELHFLTTQALSASAASAVRGCLCLRRISVAFSLASDASTVELVAALPSDLKVLDLSCPSLSPRCTLAVQSLPHLADLEVFVGCNWMVWNLAGLQHATPCLRKLVLRNGRCNGGWALPLCLEELCLIDVASIDDDALLEILSQNQRLRKVEVQSALLSGIGVAIAVRSAGCASTLRSLHLRVRGKAALSDQVAMAIGGHFHLLEELDLQVAHLTKIGIESLGVGCAGLLQLSLFDCAGIDDAGASVIGACFPKLQKLDLSRTSISMNGLRAIERGCKLLSELSLNCCFPFRDTEEVLAFCTQHWPLAKVSCNSPW